MSFREAVDILDKLEAIGTKRKEKETLLKANAGLFELRAMFVMAYDWMITYGITVKQVKREPAPGGFGVWSARDEKFGEFGVLAEALSKREITGNKAKDAWNSFIASCSNLEAVWFSRVMNRDLKIGIAETTIAKIWPAALPQFACQLAPTEGYEPGQELKFPMMVEPKYDGLRALTVVNGSRATIHSRNGKLLPGLQHFADLIADAVPGEYVLDGEVFHNSWNSTISVAKTYPENLSDQERGLLKELKYYIFDKVPLNDFKNGGNCSLPMLFRNMAVEQTLTNIGLKYPDCGVVMTPRKRVDSHEEILEFYNKSLALGFEGIMLKDPEAGYKFGRTKAWLKWKPWETVDGTVIDLLPGDADKRHGHHLGAFLVRLENGDEVRVGGALSDKQRDEFWAKKEELIGKTIEFEVQKDVNQVAVARFPEFKRFREDK